LYFSILYNESITNSPSNLHFIIFIYVDIPFPEVVKVVYCFRYGKIFNLRIYLVIVRCYCRQVLFRAPDITKCYYGMRMFVFGFAAVL